MRKELQYLILLLILFASCEEKYTPEIDTVDGQLVVDAKVTNDPAKNFVHLTQTRNYNDNVPLLAVSGAKVELIDKQNIKIESVETSSGYYVFNSVPLSGNSYFIRIGIKSDIYESAEVTMPPIPTITNFYTEDTVKRVYVTNGDGIPQATDKRGREVYADMPVTNSLSYYRFDVSSILEWTWDSIPSTSSVIPSAYGWYTYKANDNFNIAGPENFSVSTKILRHPLLMVSYNPKDYLYTDTLVSKGWILIIDQYGTSKESYDYHDMLNSQFSASGSLFDPIQNQVFGNVICKTDPSKIVYGYFDLNSYQQLRYYFDPYIPPAVTTLRQILRYPTLPTSKGIMRSQPIKGPPSEIPPPLPPPVWWEK